MNLKILFMILVYYSILGLAFASAGSVFTSERGFNYSNPLNDSSMTDEEVDTGGLFGTGITFTRWLKLVFTGIGLPDDTPSFFTLLFASWQILILILSIGFIIASIWNG